MIQASELRTGNYLNFTFMGLTEVYSVFEFTHNNVKITEDTQYQISMVSGIPLTEELLLKMGFEKTNLGYKFRVYEEYVFINKIFNDLTLEIDIRRMPLFNIKYVHQLQNLYHALTGQELTLS